MPRWKSTSHPPTRGWGSWWSTSTATSFVTSRATKTSLLANRASQTWAVWYTARGYSCFTIGVNWYVVYIKSFIHFLKTSEFIIIFIGDLCTFCKYWSRFGSLFTVGFIACTLIPQFIANIPFMVLYGIRRLYSFSYPDYQYGCIHE